MDDKITLQEGLEKFQHRNMKYFSKRLMSPEGETFLKCHDIAHVVFGCDTTIYGEGVVKIWTSFGTTSSFWKIVNGYNEVSAFELFRQYSFRHVLKNILRYLRVIPKTLFRVQKMTKPWPFADYQTYLNMPIAEIRKEFNIQIV